MNLFNSLVQIIENIPKLNQEYLIRLVYQQVLTSITTNFNGNMKAISQCLSVISSCIDNLTPIIMSCPEEFDFNTLMNGLYSYLSNSETYDSALDAIISVGNVLVEQFATYLTPVIQHLFTNFEDPSQSDMIIQTCYTIEELSKGTRTVMLTCCEQLLQKLIEMLNSELIDSKVKCSIIHAISGLAYGVGYNNFTPFRQYIINEIQNTTVGLLNMNMDYNDEDNAEFFQDMMESIIEFFGRIVEKGDESVLNFIENPITICLQLGELLRGSHGYIKQEVLYSKICYFFYSLFRLPFIGNSPQCQQIFTQNVLEVISNAYNIVDDIDGYENLTEPVEALYQSLCQIGLLQMPQSIQQQHRFFQK